MGGFDADPPALELLRGVGGVAAPTKRAPDSTDKSGLNMPRDAHTLTRIPDAPELRHTLNQSLR